MLTLLQDFLLSYCPVSVRRVWRPESLPRTVHSATWGGLAQLLLAGLVLIVRLKGFLILRTHQLAPQAPGSNETGQAIFVGVLLWEYLLQPTSLCLAYLAIEGAVRFTGGLITGEIVPSAAITLAFKSFDLIRQMQAQKHERNLPPDQLEYLPEGRIRIASAKAKAKWNGSITIGLNGQWFEVENEEKGTIMYPAIYILRPVSPGKILRGYEEYDAASAITSQATRSK